MEPKLKKKHEALQLFLEENFPGYSSSDDIAYLDDLYRAAEQLEAFHYQTILPNRTYGWIMKSKDILELSLYKEAIVSYQQKKKKEEKNEPR